MVRADGTVIRSEYPRPGERAFDERHLVRAPDGTMTAFETAGPRQRIYDGSGALVRQMVWTPDGPVDEPVPEPAFFRRRPSSRGTTENGLRLYNLFSSRNGPDSRAVVRNFQLTQRIIVTETRPR